MDSFTLRDINREARKYGLQLVNRGHHYWWSYSKDASDKVKDAIGMVPETGAGVWELQQLTWDQWMDALQHIAKSVEHQMQFLMPSARPEFNNLIPPDTKIKSGEKSMPKRIALKLSDFEVGELVSAKGRVDWGYVRKIDLAKGFMVVDYNGEKSGYTQADIDTGEVMKQNDPDDPDLMASKKKATSYKIVDRETGEFVAGGFSTAADARQTWISFGRDTSLAIVQDTDDKSEEKKKKATTFTMPSGKVVDVLSLAQEVKWIAEDQGFTDHVPEEMITDFANSIGMKDYDLATAVEQLEKSMLGNKLGKVVRIAEKPGTHPRHPEAEYDAEISDDITAVFTDDSGEQYHIRRTDLPEGHPNKTGRRADYEDGYYKGPLRDGYPPDRFDENGTFSFPWQKDLPASTAPWIGDVEKRLQSQGWTIDRTGHDRWSEMMKGSLKILLQDYGTSGTRIKVLSGGQEAKAEVLKDIPNFPAYDIYVPSKEAKQPKMMPGQEPYTDEELKKLYDMVDLSGKAIDEIGEDELERSKKRKEENKMAGLTFEKGKVKIVVKKDKDTDEWVAQVFVNGTYDEGKSYYTDDKDDAIATAKDMLERLTKSSNRQADREIDMEDMAAEDFVEEGEEETWVITIDGPKGSGFIGSSGQFVEEYPDAGQFNMYQDAHDEAANIIDSGEFADYEIGLATRIGYQDEDHQILYSPKVGRRQKKAISPFDSLRKHKQGYPLTADGALKLLEDVLEPSEWVHPQGSILVMPDPEVSGVFLVMWKDKQGERRAWIVYPEKEDFEEVNGTVAYEKYKDVAQEIDTPFDRQPPVAPQFRGSKKQAAGQADWLLADARQALERFLKAQDEGDADGLTSAAMLASKVVSKIAEYQWSKTPKTIRT